MKKPTSLLLATCFLASCAQQPMPRKPSDAGSSASTKHSASDAALGEVGSTTVAEAKLDETPWTTWYRRGQVGGLLVLSRMRDELQKKNLHDPHVDYAGYREITCDPAKSKYRSADGSCNNPRKPHAGAAGVAFGRNVPPAFIDKDAAQKLMEPNPALVSKELFTRDSFKEVPFLNMLAASWIQFMNHDWLTHGPNARQDPHRVQTERGERTVDRTREHNIPANHFKSEFGKVTLNDVTHWWDGSQIYGSSQDEQNALREFARGRMKMETVNGREILPRVTSGFDPRNNRQNQGVEATGFRDNWWVGLSMLHHLFVKEHNAIAQRLMERYARPNGTTANSWVWTGNGPRRVMTTAELDEHVFQVARLINSAVMAKIHTVEWTPAILPNDVLKRAMFTNWYGLANPQTWSPIFRNVPGLNRTDWLRGSQGGYVLGGIVGQHTSDYGVPFSITEEFTSVYRLHSLLPEHLKLRKIGERAPATGTPFGETRNEKSYDIVANTDMKDLFYSMGTQKPGQLVLNNFPKFMQEFNVPGHGQMDLAMVDVLRDRERGVPRYNQFRRAINLRPITSYADFFDADQPMDARKRAIIEKFNLVYGKNADGTDNVEAIDLLVGTSAEEVRPSNFGFGETMFQIFIVMASRRLMADRFFTTDYKPAVYTRAGIEWVDEEGWLHKVIARHMPELAPKMRGLGTAFEPWRE